MKFTESQLKSYSAPLSQSEEQKCKNAIGMVRDAMKLIGYSDEGKEIRMYETDTYAYALDLKSSGNEKITLLVQGSYANNTNVRTLSDVDVAVILESAFITEYRPGITSSNYNFSTGASFTVSTLKDDVEKALNKKFNREGVERNDKSIKVHGNNYRVDSDVVPSYRFRDYRNDYYSNPENYVGGIEIRPDSGGRIINYPEQHIKNGRSKNNETNHSFKKQVRIAKKLKQLMVDEGYKSAENVSSFGVESLLWNVPNKTYTTYSSLRFVFDEILKYLLNDFENFDSYKEANGIKSLFQNSTDKQKYMTFITDLKSFYKYDINEV
jgi:hypothetical protein